MKSALLCLAAFWLAGAGPVAGQVTNIRAGVEAPVLLEWAAMTGNPYRVYAATDLMDPAWSNLTPEGLVFTDPQGVYQPPIQEARLFYCAIASDYMIIDLAGGPTTENYPVSYTNAPPDGGWSDAYKTTNLVLRRVPGGTFIMGSPTNELGRGGDETQRQVTLMKDYYIGVYEVTQKQWELVMGSWPSYFTNAAYRDSRPVENVSYDAIRGAVAGANWPANANVDEDSFMGKLRAKTGLSALDLPTDAQWENACRAGTPTALNSGKDLTSTVSCTNVAEVCRYWYNGGNKFTQDCDPSGGTSQVGMYSANRLGLYDMHGNVWEWCLDWYSGSSGSEIDPPGPGSGTVRAARGGWWRGSSGYCRSADRFYHYPSSWGDYTGFRLAVTLP